MKEAKVIIFDFDGTLVDSKKLYIETIHKNLLEHFFIYPKSHISKALGPKLEITLNNIQKFSPKIIKRLKIKINADIKIRAKSLKLTPYSKETLQNLNKKGYNLILLTNSAGKFLKTVLKNQHIQGYFKKLFYAENFPNKETAIKRIAKRYKVKVKDITYVADKLSDVQIARNVGCKIVIVLAKSWDKNQLKGKSYSISSLKQLAKKIKDN